MNCRQIVELMTAYLEGTLSSNDRARFEEQLGQVEAGKSAGLSHMQARTLEKKLRKRFLAFLKHRGYPSGTAGTCRRWRSLRSRCS